MNHRLAIALIGAGVLLAPISAMPFLEPWAAMSLGAVVIVLLALGAALAAAAGRDAPGDDADEARFDGRSGRLDGRSADARSDRARR